MLTRLRTAFRALLDLDEPPHRIALAFGIGVFVAFSPVVLHTAIGIGLAFLFRLSRFAVVVGVWINNPWTQGPMLLAGTVLGCSMLGVPTSTLAGVDWRMEGGWRAAYQTVKPFLWPFFLGNTVMSAGLGFVGYLIVRELLNRRLRRKAVTAAGSPGGAP